MNLQSFQQLLFRLEQRSLLERLDSFSLDALKQLEQSLIQLDITTLETQINEIGKKPEKKKPGVPLSFALSGEMFEQTVDAENALKEGKVAVIVLAGGEGSRFGSASAKGLYPVTLYKQKSLLQLIAEKVLACGARYGKTPYLAIMTSDTTDQACRSFFAEHNNFSLDASQVDFFQQSSLPLLDLNANLLVNEQGQILTGPDGNGGLFYHFDTAGLFDKYRDHGVTTCAVMLVDNPLLDPFHLGMLEAHLSSQAPVTCAAITREDPTEKVGVFVKKQNRLAVVEYSEIGEQEFEAEDAKGALKFPLANISSFLFSMDFIQVLATLPEDALLLHKAKKKLTAKQKEFLGSEAPNELYKFEHFIFDVLDYAENPQVFLLERAKYFCPLKNLTGPNSIIDVQKALLTKDKAQFSFVTKTAPVNNRLFELDTQFYYPTDDLLEKWKGKKLPDNVAYIEP